ncbi:AMP-binding protein [Sphingopyxis sp. PET50]|uniref:AMP-binding protein n=1 Tax=Sphingopyxis sp. PET50 TaxID=2976533 RepID=UPI0021AF3E70|nr:AMP-binding protein [Sphingopyxis sp. PET50]
MIDLDAIRTLAHIPGAQARARGDAIAVKFGDRETSFADLDRQSNRVANALIASGIRPGDRISTLTKNHDAWYPLFFGTALSRACFAPINNRLVAAEVGFIVGDAAPKYLFVGEDFFDCALAAVAGLANPPRLVALYGEHPAFEPFDQWLGEASDAALPGPELTDDVLQLYTSGTTG